MKVLQWNIWYKEDINNIAKELKRIDADIACIQELSFVGDDRTSIKVLNEIYPYIYVETADTFLDGRSQCNAILSKYPFIGKNKSYVQEPGMDKNDYSKEGRIYLEVSIKYNNKVYNIGTTHLSYTHKFEETELKDKEVNKLIDIIKNKDNYVFTGDLNTIKSVVVLIPPLVELGDPPINIIAKIIMIVDMCILLGSNTLKPEVRQVTI